MTRNKAYKVLGINSNSSIDEIKAAYAELSKKYHPEENPKEFQEIHDAYIALTRYSKNRIRNTYAFSVNLFNENEKSEQENFVIEENRFDFSSINEAKQKEHTENLQRVINWLEDVRYSDKEIDHVLLKVILNYNNREIIYSKEFVERLIEILKESYVDDETKNVVMQYIRSWDFSLTDRRDILNMLQKVLEERNTKYRTEHYLKKRQEFGKMVLLVMMPVVLMLWLIIDFGPTVKMLVCYAIFGGMVFHIFKYCKKKYIFRTMEERKGLKQRRGSSMLNQILDWWNELDQNKRKIVIGVALGVLFVLLLGGAIFGILNKKDPVFEFPPVTFDGTETESEDTESTEVLSTENETEIESESESQAPIVEKEDPQSSVGGGMNSDTSNGASVDISQVVDKTPSNETQEVTLGIDVARYQGTIDWKKVAESGVDFAMIRVGYRELVTGKIVADSNAKYNMQEATKYGIKIGAYFFSTAITREEAIEEANWVADYIAKYQITYPVVYNCEGYEDSENRQYSLTKTQRTDMAMAFLDKIAERGYTPMFYASKNEMEGDAKWETSRLQGKYKIWVAQYPGVPYSQTAKSSYSGKHDMWQYTNNGTVPGISKPVDMNVAYFGFKETQGPQDSEKPEDVTADVEANMKFREVNETVTAKEKTNLRDKPSQGSDAKVVYTLTNGETATRTGISDSGWSRIEFKGQTLYAVSSYLTTDLSIKQPEAEPPKEPTYEEANGIKTKFMEVDDYVTIVSTVEQVNLRAKPTTQDSVSPVVVKLQKGEVVHRIGVSVDAEHTYSKVEYNGQILYCVSKYLVVVEENAEDVE